MTDTSTPQAARRRTWFLGVVVVALVLAAMVAVKALDEPTPGEGQRVDSATSAQKFEAAQHVQEQIAQLYLTRLRTHQPRLDGAAGERWLSKTQMDEQMAEARVVTPIQERALAEVGITTWTSQREYQTNAEGTVWCVRVGLSYDVDDDAIELIPLYAGEVIHPGKPFTTSEPLGEAPEPRCRAVWAGVDEG